MNHLLVNHELNRNTFSKLRWKLQTFSKTESESLQLYFRCRSNSWRRLDTRALRFFTSSAPLSSSFKKMVIICEPQTMMGIKLQFIPHNWSFLWRKHREKYILRQISSRPINLAVQALPRPARCQAKNPDKTDYIHIVSRVSIHNPSKSEAIFWKVP